MRAENRINNADQNIIPVPFFPVNTLFIISASLSTVSTFAVLLISIISRLHKDPLGKMVFWIICADFVFCFPKILACFDYKKSLEICSILQGISHFGLISSFLWAACFAHGILITLKSEDLHSLSGYFNIYALITIIVPLLGTILALFTGFVSCSESTNTCVHYVREGQIDYQYIFYTGLPLLFSSLISCLSYVLISWRLKKIFSTIPTSGLINLLLYPLILLICWLPNLLIDILIIFGISPSAGLVAAFQELGHLQGFLDALVYGGSNSTITRRLRKLCGFCRRHSSSAEEKSIEISLDQENAALTHDLRVRSLAHRKSTKNSLLEKN